MQDIAGQVAWITGAGSGIGRASAVSLAGAGVKTVLSGRRAEALEETARLVEEAGGAVRIEPLDVADREAVFAVAERIVGAYGRLDILVNNAGLNMPERSWEKIEPDGWDRVIGVDLNGAFYCAKAVLPQMRAQKGGLIVNVSSWAGRFVSRLTGPAYTAAKHAMVAMNHSLNMEECIHGIRASAVCPGEVATEILDRRPVPVTDEDKAKMVQAEDMGALILFIARTPPHVCLNEILIAPTHNRGYVAAFRG